VNDGNLLWSVDHFHGRLAGLVTSEVELTSTETEASCPRGWAPRSPTTTSTQADDSRRLRTSRSPCCWRSDGLSAPRALVR